MLEQHARGRRKPSRDVPQRRGWSLCYFSPGNTSGRAGKKGGIVFCRKCDGAPLSLIARSGKEARRRLTCSYLESHALFWPGRAIEAHSSAIACTLFFITELGSASSFRLQFQGPYVAVDVRVFWDNCLFRDSFTAVFFIYFFFTKINSHKINNVHV